MTATPASKTDWTEKAAQFEGALTPEARRNLARSLGVTRKSLRALGVGWSEADDAYTFPERDGAGAVIGILLRYEDGSKKVLPGGKRGLYLPTGWEDGEGPIYVPEGASDVAALLSVGLRGVGRPSCTGGVEYLRELFIDTDDEILIVGENDKKPDGRWPGRDGAKQVAAALARDLSGRVRWTMPPKGIKDIRECLQLEQANGD